MQSTNEPSTRSQPNSVPALADTITDQSSQSLDPPFRGYIETTYDALLVFEAARRGMIPRVTRRLIERERAMVQSGAVFVFDEHESGIKRWTDGLVWSPSRILGNFLVYRETAKRRNASGTEDHGPPGSHMYNAVGSSSTLEMVPNEHLLPSRNVEDGRAESLDKSKERQLVGSLTNSHKFKENGLVKKTMSVNVNGFAQHMISYYSVADVLADRLRTPSSITELVSLEISPEYMQKSNFRFPPVFDVGSDGVLQYKGESDDSQAPLMAPYPTPSLPGTQQQRPPGNTTDVDYSRPGTDSPALLTPLSPGGRPYPHNSIFEQQRAQYPAPPPGMSGSLNSENGATMTQSPVGPPPLGRQVSEGSVSRSNHSSSMRSTRRYEPYGSSPNNSHFPQNAKPPGVFHGMQSPLLMDEQTHSQSQSPFLPLSNHGFQYQDPNTMPSNRNPVPNSAPSHFTSFPDHSIKPTEGSRPAIPRSASNHGQPSRPYNNGGANGQLPQPPPPPSSTTSNAPLSNQSVEGSIYTGNYNASMENMTSDQIKWS